MMVSSNYFTLQNKKHEQAAKKQVEFTTFIRTEI